MKVTIFFLIAITLLLSAALIDPASAYQTDEGVEINIVPQNRVNEREPAAERSLYKKRAQHPADLHKEEESPNQLDIPIVSDIKEAVGLEDGERQRWEDCYKKCDSQKETEMVPCKRSRRCLSGAILNHKECRENCDESVQRENSIFSPFRDSRYPSGE